MAESYPQTSRTTVRRLAQRGVYDRQQIHAILDEGMICHVGFVDEGQPFVIPTIFVRIDETLYLHGSPVSRMLRHLATGAEACVTVTLVDGLVLARSAFHHSMNYRSVVVLGRGYEVKENAEKDRILFALSEHLIRGRWEAVRPPAKHELEGTLVVGIPMEEVSAKVRVGPPKDDDADYDLPVWAGVLPLRLAPGVPIPDPLLPTGRAVPSHVTQFGQDRE